MKGCVAVVTPLGLSCHAQAAVGDAKRHGCARLCLPHPMHCQPPRCTHGRCLRVWVGMAYRAGLMVSASRRVVPGLLLLSACATSDSDADLNSACEPALRVHQEALDEALAGAPDCRSDGDCVVMHDSASCEGIVQLQGCDLAVHRRVLELYDPVMVSERMCEAAEDAEFGCTVSASCQPHGASVCRAGACVFAALQ
jgi:hypothetical protein